MHAEDEMATYLIRWHANPENWPTDSKETLAVWEAACAGADQAIASGGFKEIRWINAISGYCIAEAGSKAEAMATVAAFFPYFSQTVEETAAWEEGRDATLAALRSAAGAG